MLLPVAKGPHRTIGLEAGEVMRVWTVAVGRNCAKEMSGQMENWVTYLMGSVRNMSPLYPDFLIEHVVDNFFTKKKKKSRK